VKLRFDYFHSLTRRVLYCFTPQDLKVVYEDDHIVVVDKPAGVLTVAGKQKSNNSLAQAVFDNIVSETELSNADRMVVHRLGMDTSGLIVFAKTMDAVRGMNTAFRTRAVERTYTALVCGHVQKKRGYIDLPLMRDYECPPFQRISTDEHQEALVDLDPAIVGKKLLEQPKPALTKYEVLSREELNGAPVTRVKLTSISGRTHQLNCHLAAFGHPIVGDSVYGESGDAVPNGGLSDDELLYLAPNPARAPVEQQRLANAAVSTTACHAVSIRFRHPVTNEQISLSSDAPF
jgi:tRNA pseudouridine32 synthase / 23S rRNA pseudouridine746 synthase